MAEKVEIVALLVPTGREGNLIMTIGELGLAVEQLPDLWRKAQINLPEDDEFVKEHEFRHGEQDVHLEDLGGMVGIYPDPKYPSAFYRPKGPRTAWETLKMALGPYRDTDLPGNYLPCNYVTDFFDLMIVSTFKKKVIDTDPVLFERCESEPLWKIVDDMVGKEREDKTFKLDWSKVISE